jgi:Pentapeptide repeats (8 copies)
LPPDPNHAEILRSGPKAWNAWREENPSTVPDLAGIALKASERQMGAINGGPINLKSACLQDAGLRFTTLSAADLEGSDMSGADLAHARLDRANLTAANLSNALLDHADFAGANLTKANLCGASLHHAKNLTQSQLEETIGSDSTILPPHLQSSVSWSVARSQTETTALERHDLRPRARRTVDVDIPHIGSYNRPARIVAVFLIVGALVTAGVVWRHTSLDTSGTQGGSEQSEPKPSLDTGEQGLQPIVPEALMKAKAAAEPQPSADAEMPPMPSAAKTVDRTESVPEQRPALEPGGSTVPQEASTKRSTEGFGPYEHAPGSPEEGHESKINEASDAPPLVSAESPVSMSRHGTVPDLPTKASIPDPQLTPATEASAEASLTSREHSSPPSLSDTLPPPVVTASLPSSVGQRDVQMVLPRDTGTPPMPIRDSAQLSAVAAEEPTAQPQVGTGWSEFQSPERGFAISFPATPQKTSAPVAGQNPLIRYSFQACEGDDTVYTLVVLEYPTGKAPKPDDNFYVKMVSAYAKDSQSRVRKRGPKTIAGRDGFEAITDDDKEKVNHLVDIVPAGDRVYMLISAGPRHHATSDDAERFRDSFHLTGDQSQSAASPAASP